MTDKELKKLKQDISKIKNSLIIKNPTHFSLKHTCLCSICASLSDLVERY